MALKPDYSELSRAPATFFINCIKFYNVTKRNKVVLSVHRSPIVFLFYDFKIQFSAYGENLLFYHLCSFSRISFYLLLNLKNFNVTHSEGICPVVSL
jgi:hypothetical protein